MREALCCVAPQNPTRSLLGWYGCFSGTIVICIKAYWSSLRVLHASAYIAFVLVGTLLLWALAVMVIWGPDGSWMPPERDPVPVMDMGEDEPNEPIGLNRDKGLPIPFDEGTVVDVSPKPWQTERSPKYLLVALGVAVFGLGGLLRVAGFHKAFWTATSAKHAPACRFLALAVAQSPPLARCNALGYFHAMSR